MQHKEKRLKKTQTLLLPTWKTWMIHLMPIPWLSAHMLALTYNTTQKGNPRTQMTPQCTHVHFDTQCSTRKEGCPPGKKPEVLAAHLEDPDDASNANLKKAARNLAKHKFVAVQGLNVFDLLKYDHCLLSKAAVTHLTERLGENHVS